MDIPEKIRADEYALEEWEGMFPEAVENRLHASKLNPALRIAAQSRIEMRLHEIEFGFTPAGATKVHAKQILEI